ncbi:hypothetical protein J2Y69_001397 [Microbacterium resistens]|uniref:Uncharacterized protein n=1 Tax=Microbacterium resistens TaxID=156977 RepID=A0ABU1SD17_9MICO|nr:hypothetical protein [Microbacterium resistens]
MHEFVPVRSTVPVNENYRPESFAFCPADETHTGPLGGVCPECGTPM